MSVGRRFTVPYRARRASSASPRPSARHDDTREANRSGPIAHLAAVIAASFVVIWMAAAVGCSTPDEAAQNNASPPAAQPREEVTPVRGEGAARPLSPASATETTPAPREEPATPVATSSPDAAPSPAAAPSPESGATVADPVPSPAAAKPDPPVSPKGRPAPPSEGENAQARGSGGPDNSDARAKGSPTPAPEQQAVVRALLADEGPAFTWQDGEHTRQVRLVPGVVAEPAADSTGIVVRQAQHSSNTEPVFLSAEGELMTLPGGVLLALDPEWSESEVDRFFSANGIAQTRISERSFTANAFFVETAPGLPSLELANALAGQEGVAISSPNWRRESTTR